MATIDKTNDRVRGTTPIVQAAAKELRRNPTPAERRLWDAIRERRLGGLRFRRQHPVGPFILDFYCPSHKLVIELDGDIHATQKDQDDYRDQHLASYGYRVLRFRNDEVFRSLPTVLTRILHAAAEIGDDPSPTSPPKRP